MVARLILLRLATALLTLLAVSVLIFVVVQVLPGDIAVRVLGRAATQEAIQAFHERLHLDQPIYERYLLWLYGAVQGDLGRSLVSQRPVWQIVAPRLGNTLLLGGYALALYVPLSILLATLAAVYQDRALDNAISLATLFGLSLPEFAVGTALLVAFAVTIPLFPVMSLIEQAKTPADVLRILALPAITLTITIVPYAVRMLRDNLIEVLNSDYVRMAILKGLPTYRVIFWHALPNALIPALNVTALNLAYMIGSVVIVEQVFAYPGLGSLLVESVFLRDAPVVQAVALLVSAIYILANLFADTMAYLLNPRLRTG